MFGIGQGEFIVILLLAVVFLGPQRLPEVARWLAKAFHTLQQWKTEFDRQLTEIRKEVEAVADVKLEAHPAQGGAASGDSASDDEAAEDVDDYLADTGAGEADANPDYTYQRELPLEAGDETEAEDVSDG